jgi:hypothetical protein
MGDVGNLTVGFLRALVNWPLSLRASIHAAVERRRAKVLLDRALIDARKEDASE